jgi:hypothetical protein
MRAFITYQSMIRGSYLPDPRNQENKQMKDQLNLWLNSCCYNLTIPINSSDRWTTFFSAPRWYDAAASPCHLFTRDHDHVAKTSRVDYYRAPCGNRRIAPLVPTSDGWDDRCAPLSYKRETLPWCCHCQVSPAFELDAAATFVSSPASFWPSRH